MNWVDIVLAFIMGGLMGGLAVALDASKYLTELSRARRAIEFASYMAKSAESYMDEVNTKALADEIDDDGHNTDALSDAFSGLRSAIYEFRKRERKVING